ncbi:MAG: hypothetical protein P1V20_10555 [Verrucomicrobiales bacterium]|nr:hypothetical protein [Verrucomicrobiales bacterium]
MNIENRLKLFQTEKTKILGFGRSHLRSVDLARRLEADVEKKIRKAKKEFTSKQVFLFFLWDTVKERGDELLRREHFQFRVFDEGTVEFLDQNFIKRPGNGFATRYEDVAREMTLLPEKVRAVLQLHYQSGMSCKTIAKKIGIPVEEVYQLWQHSLIYLWETLQNGENEGFQEPEDEAFWTLALKYLDGTASEKFVAQLNSEIHVSKTRTRQYNDLRMIDGIMIGFGELDIWPECELANDIIRLPPTKRRSLSRKSKSPNKPESDHPEHQRADEPPKYAVLALGMLATALSATGNFVERIFPGKRKKASAPQDTDTRPKLPPSPSSETILPPVPGSGPPVLAHEDRDQTHRHGVHIDKPPLIPKVKVDPSLLRKIGIITVIGGLACLLALLAIRTDLLSRFKSHPKVLREANVKFADDTPWNRTSLTYGSYHMTEGTCEIFTSDSVSLIIEAPARFSITSGHGIRLDEGRMVAKVTSRTPKGFTIKTDRFTFSSSEGEIGVLSDKDSIDLIVFNGAGTVAEKNRAVGPGEGLRFFDIGEPESIVARDQAHRFPESIPVVTPKSYGDNLIVNHSFEIGLLSRSCKTERLYRDVPLAWKAGWQKDGVWTDALEQHSGTVRITDAIGGLPTPAEGERYLWVNHGFVAQEIHDFEPGAEYRLSVQIGSHRNFGPGAGHLVRHIGGNVFRFGIWSGSEWLAETSGQLEAGQPFQEMQMTFRFPENGLPGMIPVLMLSGETRIFYDNIQLKKMP